MASSIFRRHRLSREAFRGPGLALVTVVTRHRVQCLTAPGVAGPLLDDLRRCLIRNTCRAEAYCVMPDHLHILVAGVVEASDAWQAIVEFKQTTATGSVGVAPILWQRSFDIRLLAPGAKTEAAAAYVLNNPVRAGLVAAWQQWPHSGSIGETREAGQC